MAVELKGVFNHLVVKPIAQKAQTAGGIMLPEGTSGGPSRGTIVSLGSKVKENDDQLEVGQEIYYYPGADMSEIKEDGVAYTILRLVDVWCIREDK